jgi:mono/diheme cytochrome c family protein
MREQLARWVAGITALITLALALTFAWMQNPGVDEPGEVRPDVHESDPALLAAGRGVYDGQGCSMCHSIAGQGNPRNPLDGAGARHDPAALRDWIIGADALGDQMSARTRRTKQDYRDLSDADLDALVAYMQSL